MRKTLSGERLEHQMRDHVKSDTSLPKFNHGPSKAIQSYRRLWLKSDLLGRSYVRLALVSQKRRLIVRGA